jgi:hypothetical protein
MVAQSKRWSLTFSYPGPPKHKEENIVNPFKDLKPKTKMTLIICVTVIAVSLIVGAAMTDNFDLLLSLFDKAAPK